MNDKDITKYFNRLYIKLLDVKYDLKITKKEFLALNEVHNLITSQQAEIERLQSGVIQTHNTVPELVRQAKDEAIKECIEKVAEKVEKARQKYQRLCKEQGEEEDEVMNIHFRGMINIVKEMVGEDNGETQKM